MTAQPTAHRPPPPAFAASAARFGTGSLLGLAAGLARDVAFGRLYGVTAQADLMLLATNLPYGLGTSVTNALDAAVLPGLRGARGARAARMLDRLERGLVPLLLLASPLALVGLGGPLESTASLRPAGTGVAIVGLAILLFCASGLLTVRLRCRLGRAHRFFLAGALPALVPLGIVTGLVLPLPGALDLLGPLLGAVAGAGVALVLAGPLPAPATSGGDLRLALAYVRRGLPVMVAAALFALSNVAVRAVAGLGPAGSVAALEYATRLFNAPSTLLVTSAAAVLLPLRAAAPDTLPDRHDFGRQAGWSVVVTAPVALGVTALAGLVARLLLGAAAGAGSAIVLNTACLTAGLPAMLLVNLRMRADQAARNSRTSLLGAVATLVAAGLAAGLLAWRGHWSLLGLAPTAGLAAVLAGVVRHGSYSMPKGRAVAPGVLTLVAGALAALAGLVLAGGAPGALAPALAGTLATGWLVGEACSALARRSA